jgi:flagellin
VTVNTASIGSGVDASAIGSVIQDIDKAIDTINDKRATFGATQSRFEAVISNLQVAVENQSAAKSRILDADFAVETANMSRAQILQQASTAMIAQANQLPQQVLRLLQ